MIGGEIRRNAVPRLTVVSRAEEELRADVNRALLIGAHVDRRVPVEAQLPFPVIRLRLDETALEREMIHAADLAALRFSVNVVRVGGIRKYPETLPPKKILPAAVGNPARILRVAHPRAVVLQSAEDVIWIRVVPTYGIELRDRKCFPLPPGIPATAGIPNPSLI